MAAKPKGRTKISAGAEKNARERLIEAGLDEFGRYGFEAATTRRIARSAGVNIALIPYYFDGKQGLYNAVVEHATGHVTSRVSAVLEEIHSCSDSLSSGQATDLLLKLLARIVDFMVGSEEALRFARLNLREQLYPSSAYDIIYSRLMAPIIQAIARMLSIAVGTPVTETVQLRALSLLGQIMAFRVARETVVRLLGMSGYSSVEAETIRKVILEQTGATIRGLVQDQQQKKENA